MGSPIQPYSLTKNNQFWLLLAFLIMASYDENLCKELFYKVHGPLKAIIDTYLPKCCNTTGYVDKKVIQSKFDKLELTSLTYEVMNLLNDLKNYLHIFASFRKDIKAIHKNHEENMDQLLQKFTQKITSESKIELANQIDVAKVELTNLLSLNKQYEEKPKVTKKHISNDKAKKSKSYSDKLKENLSVKLKDVPVSKATLNREGQAILIFPTPESCSQAKDSLQTEFNVTNSDRKQKIIQPRVKIHNLDPKLSQK